LQLQQFAVEDKIKSGYDFFNGKRIVDNAKYQTNLRSKKHCGSIAGCCGGVPIVN
jgi:hypothetical protein